MVSFRSKKISREDIGDTLRKARAACGYSLRRAADRAGISEKTAAALEAGAFETIRGSVYLRGFVARYAESVGLNPKPLLKCLPKARIAALHVPLKERRLFFTPALFRAACGALLAGAVLLYVGGEWRSLIRPPKLEVLSPSDGSVVGAASLEIQGMSEPTALLAVNGAPVAAQASGAFFSLVTLHEGTNTITVTAARKHGRKRSVSRQVIYTPQIGTWKSEVGGWN